MKIIIVGCGLSGCVAANLLKRKGHTIEIFETRDHIAGNCYDKDIRGVNVHQYGAHIFHTKDQQVWDFVNRFARFNNYTHRVRANTKEGLISIPYSKKTENELGRKLSDTEIHELIFREYSERHWGTTWENLPSSITQRVPQRRLNEDDRYFEEKYQGIPIDGYTNMFSNMLEGISVQLEVEPNDWRKKKADLFIYTGKADEYFDYQWGHLPYRSLKFEHQIADPQSDFSFEKGAVINECNTLSYNRTVDNSAFLADKKGKTVLTRDYPSEHNEENLPIYPKNFGAGLALYKNHYKKAISAQKNTIFLGRLATYKYLDMWMAIKQAMRLADDF